jgi:Na+/melibiose symporter-like transporter
VALIKRPSVVRILAADLLIGTGPAITGALFFFFFERVKGFGKAEASALLLIYFLGGLVGAPLWTWLSYRIGKHRALAVSGLIYTAMTLAVLLIPEGNFISAAVLMALIGIPYAAGAFLLRSMMADIGDEERLESGVDRTGLLYALLAGTVKIGSAVAVGATFPALQALGFNAAVKGGESGLVALSFLFTAVPAGMALLAAWIVLGFPITAARHAEIRDALAARDLIEAAPEMSSDPLIAEEIHAPPVHAPH